MVSSCKPSLRETTKRWMALHLSVDGEPSLRETTKRWMALHLLVDGEGVDWVIETKGAIKKANLTFTAKFL